MPVNIKEQFQGILAEHKKAFDASFTPAQIDVLDKVAREFLRALKAGNKLMFCGNGGSASDSQHISAEFVGRFKIDRPSLPAISLTVDTSALTAIGNDYGYEQVFSRQVEGLGCKGDVLVAISTSGHSKNVLEAVRAAKKKGITVVGFTGASGGTLAQETALCFKAESKLTSHVQEIHITALHAVSEVVENVFFA